MALIILCRRARARVATALPALSAVLVVPAALMAMTGLFTPDEGGDGGAENDSEGDSDGDDRGEDEEPLGDAGKRALDAERRARRAAERERTRLTNELERLRETTQSEGDKALADARAEGERAAATAYQDRILRSEVTAAAAGRLADPADAIRLLDFEQFDVGADGNVETKAITSAIDELLKDKPYLAGRSRTAGDADGGARGAETTNGTDMNSLLRAAATGR